MTYRVGTRAALAATLAVDDSCVLNDPSVLCAYDPLAIDERFADRQSEVAGRIGSVGLAAFRVWRADDDGATLRAELSKLGPVFCKVGQTLATRPDIVGLETSRNLGKLQDAMEPEPDPATAMATLSTALGGDVSSRLRNISAAPVAAASLAEVYRANLPDGTPVAVKIQRPGLERKVALDFYVMRRALELVQRRFDIAADVEQVVAVLDEVGGEGNRSSTCTLPQPLSQPLPPPPHLLFAPKQVDGEMFAEIDHALCTPPVHCLSACLCTACTLHAHALHAYTLACGRGPLHMYIGGRGPLCRARLCDGGEAHAPLPGAPLPHA